MHLKQTASTAIMSSSESNARALARSPPPCSRGEDSTSFSASDSGGGAIFVPTDCSVVDTAQRSRNGLKRTLSPSSELSKPPGDSSPGEVGREQRRPSHHPDPLHIATTTVTSSCCS